MIDVDTSRDVTLAAGASPEATITHRGHELILAVQEDCSVSAFLRRTGAFYEQPFLEALEQTVPDGLSVIDAGAHIGNHTLFFAGVMGRRVLAVEAHPGHADLLRRNVARNVPADRVEVIQVALSDGAGAGRLARLVPGDAGTVSLADAQSRPGGLAVQMTTLDQLVTDHPVGAVGLLKIDVEGHELAVLRGAQLLLRDHRPVVTTEVGDLAHFDEVRGLLGGLGYVAVACLNPTATVIWAAADGVGGGLARDHPVLETSVRHAVRLTADVNRVRGQLARAVQPPVTRAGAHAGPHLLVIGDDLTVDRPTPRTELSHIRLTRLGTGPAPGSPRSRTAVVQDVLDAVEHHGVPALVLAEHSPATHPVIEAVIGALGVPYVLHYRGELPAHHSTWPLINGARHRILDGPDPADWQSRLIFAAEPLVGPMEQSVARWCSSTPVAPTRPPPRGGELRVALVSYYAAPCHSVGVHRIEYWRRNLARIAAARGVQMCVDLFTASGATDHVPGYQRVPDLGRSGRTGPDVDHLLKELERLQLDTISVTWPATLVPAIEERGPYDVTVFSGNPFHCFRAAEKVRDLGSKVVLDFRDPMVDNPRLAFRREQRALFRDLQARYLAAADAVTSVNATCLDLICGESYPGRRLVVSNGFDETVVTRGPNRAARSSSHAGATLVLGGRLYRTHDPRPLLDVLTGSPHRLMHAGPPHQALADREEPTVRSLGRLPLAGLASVLAEADLGLIFTNGDPFEHTTKVFDYVGADLDVLIITDGEPCTGELHTLTEHLPGVLWARNSADEIRAALAAYTPRTTVRPHRDSFSRAAQTERLVDLLLELADTTPTAPERPDSDPRQ